MKRIVMYGWVLFMIVGCTLDPGMKKDNGELFDKNSTWKKLNDKQMREKLQYV